jgi:hypothetical protein
MGLIALANPVQAATNLVKNGSFESNSGPGYVSSHPIQDWTHINTATSGVSINAINTFAQLQANTSTPIPLWGVSPTYLNGNGIRNSNDGGYFLIADGWPQYTAIFEQVIAGLTPGTQYELNYEYAFGQQASFDGPTTQKWTGSFGSESFETATVNLVSHGFDGGPGPGWYTATHTFTASSASQALRFLAVGSPGLPPMALLDGVSLTEVTPPPTPTPTPAPMPLLGVGATLAWSGRLRRRIKRVGKN